MPCRACRKNPYSCSTHKAQVPRAGETWLNRIAGKYKIICVARPNNFGAPWVVALESEEGEIWYTPVSDLFEEISNPEGSPIRRWHKLE